MDRLEATVRQRSASTFRLNKTAALNRRFTGGNQENWRQLAKDISVVARLVGRATGTSQKQTFRMQRWVSSIGDARMSLGTILLIILILLLIGALPTWGHSRSWGPWPAGGLGLILLIVLILVLMGRIWAGVA
jgi:hypothetical protein